MSEIMREMILLGSTIPVADYVSSLKKQPEYRARFDDVFSGYDFLITPSTASAAPLIGQSEREDTCLIWTFLGYPVVSLPVFWSPATNLPFGLQIVAPKFADLPLLDFGQRLVEDFRPIAH